MASPKTKRKLTAILCADVVGYSRLMGADEEATIETLTTYRKVFLSQIESHNGSVVDAKGDAILAEFVSVVDAVKGAVEIQRDLAEKNAKLPDDRRMDFRIGLNLGRGRSASSLPYRSESTIFRGTVPARRVTRSRIADNPRVTGRLQSAADMAPDFAERDRKPRTPCPRG